MAYSSKERLINDKIDVPRYDGISESNGDTQIKKDILRESLAEKDFNLPTYDEYTTEGFVLVPPAQNVEASAPPEILANSVNFTNEEVKDALIDYTSQKCCYGTKAAKQALINKVSPATAFHYILETFSERRSTEWSFKPFHGGSFDGPENGYPPMPWDIVVPYPGDFKEHKMIVEVPHTSKIRNCKHCHGRGETKCHSCNFGRVSCSFCSNGRVRSTDSEGCERFQNCSSCHGMGVRNCISCNGKGYNKCKICQGSGELRFFVKLTIKWTNYKDSYIEGGSDLPEKLIKEAQGDVLLVDENYRISPVNCFPIPAINIAAADIMNRQMNKVINERLLKQRQTIQAVPCSEVDYEYNGKPHRFFVYGHEKRVFTFEYPQSCCWCCTIV